MSSKKDDDREDRGETAACGAQAAAPRPAEPSSHEEEEEEEDEGQGTEEDYAEDDGHNGEEENSVSSRRRRKKGGNPITREMIRKRAEHNESIIWSLEELTLHQEEISRIAPVLGSSCRKLKILYLQNNIIGKMENLHHLKDLEYLNLALNNITRIEGLASCEFLKKLDLTVNFVDLDELEASIEHLKPREHLRELYMMGNPAHSDWPGFKNYVVASLPQLRTLDGVDILRSTRIVAAQQYPHLRLELRRLAESKRREKLTQADTMDDGDDDIDTDAATPYTPAVRTAMYEEMAEEKAEHDRRRLENAPRERDNDKEQAEAVARARKREADGEIPLQCNQGKWDFAFDEDVTPGALVLDVAVQRHLDSSLIDLDVHPHYVSVVIKAKMLRLALPVEVRASEAVAKRSQATGHLVVTMPKVDQKAMPFFAAKSSQRAVSATSADATTTDKNNNNTDRRDKNFRPKPRTVRRAVQPSLGSLLLSDAAATRAAESTIAPAVLETDATTTTTKQTVPPPPPSHCASAGDADDAPPPPLASSAARLPPSGPECNAQSRSLF